MKEHKSHARYQIAKISLTIHYIGSKAAREIPTTGPSHHTGGRVRSSIHLQSSIPMFPENPHVHIINQINPKDRQTVEHPHVKRNKETKE